MLSYLILNSSSGKIHPVGPPSQHPSSNEATSAPHTENSNNLMATRTTNPTTPQLMVTNNKDGMFRNEDNEKNTSKFEGKNERETNNQM